MEIDVSGGPRIEFQLVSLDRHREQLVAPHPGSARLCRDGVLSRTATFPESP